MLFYGGRVILSCSLLVLAAAVGGCQRGPSWELTPVEGTVTKGGRPVANLRVIFLPDADAGIVGPRSTGWTDESGHYRLRTEYGNEGAVVGKHRIAVRDTKINEQQMSNRAHGSPPLEMIERLQEQRKTAATAPRVPPSYERFDETPLRVEVRPGSPVIDLEVK